MDKLVRVAWIDGPKYPVCVCIRVYSKRACAYRYVIIHMYIVRNIYVYMCMVICHMFVDMHVCIHTYTYVYICKYMCIHVYMYICICIYTCVYMYVCIW